MLQCHLSQLIADVDAAAPDAQTKYVFPWEIGEKELIFGKVVSVVGDRYDLSGFILN
jgi:hypothetical protein